MSVVVLIAPNHKLESFLPLVGRPLSTLATLQGPRNIELEAEEYPRKCYKFYSCSRSIILGYSLIRI
jgi:hypothetical protein